VAPQRQAMGEQQASDFVAKLRGDQRDTFMRGVESAEAKQSQKDIEDGLIDLDKSLLDLRKFKVGSDAKQQIVTRSRTMIDQMVQAQDALYQQFRDDPANRAQIQQKINALDKQIQVYAAQAENAEKILSGSPEAAEIAAGEASRMSRYLEMLGAEPELVENYRRVFMENGDITNAKRLIMIRIGRGQALKPQPKSGIGVRKPGYSTPKPLR
jgi:hypothetical protein